MVNLFNEIFREHEPDPDSVRMDFLLQTNISDYDIIYSRFCGLRMVHVKTSSGF